MTGSPAPDYAGPVSRAVAYLLDVVVVALLFTGGAVVAGLIASVVATPRQQDLLHAAISAFTLVLPAVFAVYCAAFWSLAARTPGMAVLGLRVVPVRRRGAAWPFALLRGVVLAYFPIGALWALVDHRRQGLHDKLAGTAVVRVPSPAAAPSVAR